MALLKSLTNDKGVVTNYHKVGSVTLTDGLITCFIDSYVSKEYRNNEQSADSQMFRFETTLEEEESCGIRELCYRKLKELPEWDDAQDC